MKFNTSSFSCLHSTYQARLKHQNSSVQSSRVPKIPGFQKFQSSRSFNVPGFQGSRFQGSNVPMFHGFQGSRAPGFQSSRDHMVPGFQKFQGSRVPEVSKFQGSRSFKVPGFQVPGQGSKVPGFHGSRVPFRILRAASPRSSAPVPEIETQALLLGIFLFW